MENNSSYRVYTEMYTDGSYSVPVTLDRDFNFLEVLSLKISQEDIYKLHTSSYGIVTGRVLANGGVGIENARLSVFIPATEETKNDIFRSILYPYTDVTGKNPENDIRYNLLTDTKLSKCHREVGTFPNKRLVLDNKDMLEIYDGYYRYSTVTNQAGDYMFYGLPVNENMIHVDIDLSDIGILSQKPRDMFFKGYNEKQFDSASQFKKDTNLDNLTQIISQNQNVFVYPFWGDSQASEVAITRCDINIQYKFESTCIFMGSIFTDQQQNAVMKNCLPARALGNMSSLTTGEGKIEMIRKNFDGQTEEYQINGNRLIDGDGVWCFQIPMNLDYVVTDEFGNLVPADDPSKGIATSARMRFRISLDNVSDDGFDKKRGAYLLPHNPQTKEEIDYSFGASTLDSSFATLLWNKVYSVKGYVPRLQISTSYSSRNFTGIKSINNYGQNNPFPYNNILIKLPVMYVIICLIMMVVIDVVGFINNLFGKLRCWVIEVPFLWTTFKYNAGDKVFSFLHCINMGAGWCTYYQEKDIVPRCECVHLTKELNSPGGFMNKVDEIKNCIITGLAEENEVYNFDFANDWVNGSLYAPLFQTKIKRKTRRRFFGLFGSKIVSETLTFCGKINGDQNASTTNGWLFKRGVNQLKIFTTCSLTMTKASGSDTFKFVWKDVKLGNDLCSKKDCFKQISYLSSPDGYVNQVVDDADAKNWYYVPSIMKTVKVLNIKQEFPLLYFPADIILLGTVNDCDLDGIFPLHVMLPSTTYKLPPPLQEIGEDVDLNDAKNVSVATTLEATGINWGMDGGKKSKDQESDTHNKRAYSKGGKDGETGPTGLFVGLYCTRSDTFHKTCINLSRICELGVSLDESDIEYSNCKDSPVVIPPDGWILKKDELDQSEARQMFATLNSIPFYNRKGEENIVESGGRKYYNFKYYYPDNFDGRMYPYIIPDKPGTYVNKDNEVMDQYYMRFRFGERDQSRYYVPTNYQFPRYVNSFYFYFGIRAGKTAIDKFRSAFYSECVSVVKAPFIVQPDVVCGAMVCSCGGQTVPPPVEVDVTIREFKSSYSLQLQTNDGTVLQLKNAVPGGGTSGLFKRMIKITSCKPGDEKCPEGLDFYCEDLWKGGIFNLFVTDDSGLQVKASFTVPVSGVVSFDWVLTGMSGLNSGTSADNYIGVQTSTDEIDKGNIRISNIDSIHDKGCFLRDYALEITRQVFISEDRLTGTKRFSLAATKVYTYSDPDWKKICDAYDSLSTEEDFVFTMYFWEGNYDISLKNICGGSAQCKCGNDFKDIDCSFEIPEPIEIKINQDIRAKYLAVNTKTTLAEKDAWWNAFYVYLVSNVTDRNSLKTYYTDPVYADAAQTTDEDVKNMKRSLQDAFVMMCDFDRDMLNVLGDGFDPPYKPYLFGLKPYVTSTGTNPVFIINAGGSGYTAGSPVEVVQGSSAEDNMTVNITLNGSAIASVTSVASWGKRGYMDGAVKFKQGNNITAQGRICGPQSQDTIVRDNIVIQMEEPLMNSEGIVYKTEMYAMRRLPAPSFYKPGGYFAGIIGESGFGKAWPENFKVWLNNYRKTAQGIEDETVDVFELYWNAINDGKQTPANDASGWQTFALKNLFYFQVFDRRMVFYIPLLRTVASNPNYCRCEAGGSGETIALPAFVNGVFMNGPNVPLMVSYTEEVKEGDTPESSDSQFTVSPGNYVMVNCDDLMASDSGAYYFGTDAGKIPSLRGFNTNIRVNLNNEVYLWKLNDNITEGCGNPAEIKTGLDFAIFGLFVSTSIPYSSACVDGESTSGIPGVSRTAIFRVLSSELNDLTVADSSKTRVPCTLIVVSCASFAYMPINVFLPPSTFPLKPRSTMFRCGTAMYAANEKIVGINNSTAGLIFNESSEIPPVYSDIVPSTISVQGTNIPSFLDKIDGSVKKLNTSDLTVRISPSATLDNAQNAIIGKNIEYSESGYKNMYYVVGVKSDGVRAYSQPLDFSYNRISATVSDTGSASSVNISVTFNGNGVLKNNGYRFKAAAGTVNASYSGLEDFFVSDGSLEIVKVISGTNIASFDNFPVNRRDSSKIIRLIVENSLGMAHMLYISPYYWIGDGNAIKCGPCNGSLFIRLYGTLPSASTAVPTAFTYYRPDSDALGGIVLDGSRKIKLKVASGSSPLLTADQYVALKMGTSADLPSCCPCNPQLSGLSFSPSASLSPSFNSSTYSYTANFGTFTYLTTVYIYCSVTDSGCYSADATSKSVYLNGSGSQSTSFTVTTKDGTASHTYNISIRYTYSPPPPDPTP
jgi:hypothetical protein